MNTIGHRLREERMPLGISQDELAAAGGVQRRAQGNYERERTKPGLRILGRNFQNRRGYPLHRDGQSGLD